MYAKAYVSWTAGDIHVDKIRQFANTTYTLEMHTQLTRPSRLRQLHDLRISDAEAEPLG